MSAFGAKSDIGEPRSGRPWLRRYSAALEGCRRDLVGNE
jgi:hypothetical protein